MAATGRPPVIVDRAPPIYRALMLEIERRRQQLGWPMWRLDEVAGTQDGYYAKMLHADRPSGRCAGWPMLHLVVSALFPEGVDLELRPKVGGVLTPESMRMKIRFAAADNDRRSRRELMRELGKLGAAARAKKLTAARKLKIARKASRAAAHKRTERGMIKNTSALQALLDAAE